TKVTKKFWPSISNLFCDLCAFLGLTLLLLCLLWLREGLGEHARNQFVEARVGVVVEAFVERRELSQHFGFSFRLLRARAQGDGACVGVDHALAEFHQFAPR